MLAEKVKKFIDSNELLSENESVLVGFSGGADSVCLLHILKSLSYPVSAAHLNHGLRGKEAERDENFAQAFCFKYGIPFFAAHKNISAIANATGVSEETAGRNERYKFFDEVASKNQVDKIATAHNKNDNAETLLMHLLRGTSTDGLSGIPQKRGNIIRPLLSCTREEIEEYCNKHNLSYVTDSTNLKNIYMRNKIRLDLIPQLETYNPNIISTLTNLCELSSVDKDYFTTQTDKILSGNTTADICKLKYLHDALLYRTISKLCNNAGLSPEYKHIKIIADAIKADLSGKRFDIPGGFVELSCGKLSANRQEVNKFNFKISPDTDIIIGKYHIKASDSVLSDTYFVIPITSEVIVRSRLDGDKIKVHGMTKKISDIFIDRKIPSSLRNNIPILTIDDEIYYIFDIEKSDLSTNETKNGKSFVLNISNKEYTNE